MIVSSPMERYATAVFGFAVLLQLVLGGWRTRILGSSPLPALALAGLLATIGLLWLARHRQTGAAPLGGFVALVFATVGVLSAISAANAPLIGAVARISIPLFAFSAAAVLMTATLEKRFQIAAMIVFLAALALLEADLTRDALWEASGSVIPRRGPSHPDSSLTLGRQ